MSGWMRDPRVRADERSNTNPGKKSLDGSGRLTAYAEINT
jgi:hypothetical protein